MYVLAWIVSVAATAAISYYMGRDRGLWQGYVQGYTAGRKVAWHFRYEQPSRN